MRSVYVLLSLASGISVLWITLKSSSAFVNPLTLYASVWMILVPLSSFSAPLMEAMSNREIQICALAGVAFSFGGIIATLSGWQNEADVRQDSANKGELDARMRFFADVLVIVSILALALNLVLEGRIALFDIDSTDRKAASHFFAYPFLSSLGTISLALYGILGRVSRIQGIAVLVFLSLQLLTAQRFVAIVGLLLALGALASSDSNARRGLGRVFWLAVGAVGAFLFVSLFRGGASDQRKYFIETGLYGGDPIVLQTTEILRYIGMSQRNMGEVFSRTIDPGTVLQFTASPITGIFGDAPMGLGTNTFGYTATNAVAYLYSDFFWYWPFAIVLWSMMVNLVFQRSRVVGSFSANFLWSVCALGLSMSFFAYVHAYLYWVVLFPLLVYIYERWVMLTLTARQHPRTVRRANFGGSLS